MSKTKKKVNLLTSEANKKEPRSEPDREVSLSPIWAFQNLDIGGPWCLSKVLAVTSIIDILQKMGHFEKMTWQELGAEGSHAISVTRCNKDAQARLLEIKLDDIDELYSFRVTGKMRIWGIRDRNIVKVLWWDPNHEICPSLKK